LDTKTLLFQLTTHPELNHSKGLSKAKSEHLSIWLEGCGVEIEMTNTAETNALTLQDVLTPLPLELRWAGLSGVRGVLGKRMRIRQHMEVDR